MNIFKPKAINRKYEFYYLNNLNFSKDEFNNFMFFLNKSLPCVIRFNKLNNQIIANNLLNSIYKLANQNNIPISRVEIASKKNTNYRGNILSLDIDKRNLRKLEDCSNLHKCLDDSSKLGLLTRQELVSMIPPILLKPLPGNNVLDMCAAPGSKTTQIIEYLNNVNFINNSNIEDNNKIDNITDLNHFDIYSEHYKNIPNSYIVANDTSFSRCQLLHHNIKRLNISNYLITQLSAEEFPINFLNKEELIKFDRVLCDVPCSGDAVLRKYPEQWTQWNCSTGIKLHKLQLGILTRGALMLKNEGRLVYSTCSFNPVENEAVIQQFLYNMETDEDNIYEYEVLNVSNNNEISKNEIDSDFITRKGLKNWTIYLEDFLFKKNDNLKTNNKDQIKNNNLNVENNEYDNLNIVIENNLKELDIADLYNKKYTNISSFTPISVFDIDNILKLKSKISVDDNIYKKLNNNLATKLKDQINNCIRIFPQDNNTSGFFICVIYKKLKNSSINNKSNKLINKIKHNYISPYTNDQIVKLSNIKSDSNNKETFDYDLEKQVKNIKQSLSNYYGINKEVEFLSKFNFDNLLTKTDKIRKLYYVNNTNLSNMLYTKNIKLRTIASGVRIFEKSTINCINKNIYNDKENTELCNYSYRICTEGIKFIAPYICKQIIYTSNIQEFKDFINECSLIDNKLNNSILNDIKINSIKNGCFIVVLTTENFYKKYFNVLNNNFINTKLNNALNEDTVYLKPNKEKQKFNCKNINFFKSFESNYLDGVSCILVNNKIHVSLSKEEKELLLYKLDNYI